MKKGSKKKPAEEDEAEAKDVGSEAVERMLASIVPSKPLVDWVPGTAGSPSLEMAAPPPAASQHKAWVAGEDAAQVAAALESAWAAAMS